MSIGSSRSFDEALSPARRRKHFRSLTGGVAACAHGRYGPDYAILMARVAANRFMATK
jgi:hypothetical protein